MFYIVKFKRSGWAGAVLLSFGALIMLALFTVNMCTKEETFCQDTEKDSLVIDPGHGGLDGGAVSANGIKESDLNLSIALKVQKAAEFCGVDVHMTREDDSLNADSGSYSELAELKRRTALVNSAPDPVLISIHQNCFPTSQPSGSQVLYAGTKGSRELGELIQENLRVQLDSENRRLAEPAPAELYITSNVKCPAVLAECGFMSNFSDMEKLCDRSYQTGLAAVFLGSYLQFRNALI